MVGDTVCQGRLVLGVMSVPALADQTSPFSCWTVMHAGASFCFPVAVLH